MDRNPSREVRGNACLALATLRKDDAKYGTNKQASNGRGRETVSTCHCGIRPGEKGWNPLAELAKPELYELQCLSIGKPAPPTEGEDLGGRSLRLRDYRGKVVLLVFWGACGGCRPDVTALRGLLERFKGKPFVILGVYCDEDVAKAREIAEKTGMIWPSLRDRRSGPISKE